MGDPSFDTFEKLGETVHVSDAEYPWAVNGSLFRDPKDGAWYLFPGLYKFGYAMNDDLVAPDFSGGAVDGSSAKLTEKIRDAKHGNVPGLFLIYRSRDEGKTWECLGEGFQRGFTIKRPDGTPYDAPVAVYPDVCMEYDPATARYYLSYDFCNEGWDWKNDGGLEADSGCALAWAPSPTGPFTHIGACVTNHQYDNRIGRFTRMYATTAIRRESDWIIFILCDSGSNHSWGYATAMASSPKGPWSKPEVILSVDSPDYFPAPVECHPAFVHDGFVYAPATSIALNRNYQAVFRAPLEDAHRAEAWRLCDDGNVWHARPLPQEKHGIWGQTFHGFVHEGKFNVMYPAKDTRNFGTVQIATRPWDTPHSDGFTLSGHEGSSLSPLLHGYGDFSVEADIDFTGTIEIAFDYRGILGPNSSVANSVPCDAALRNYSALRMMDNGIFSLVTVNSDGSVTTHAAEMLTCDETIRQVKIERHGATVRVWVNWKSVIMINVEPHAESIEPISHYPLALICHRFSILNCSQFVVTGEPQPTTLVYNAYDALLGAGQNLANWRIDGDTLIATNHAVCKAKWNVICAAFELQGLVGKCTIEADGEPLGTLAAGETFKATLPRGRHAITLHSLAGETFAIRDIVCHL